jgi:chromosome segregation ATPase
MKGTAIWLQEQVQLCDKAADVARTQAWLYLSQNEGFQSTVDDLTKEKVALEQRNQHLSAENSNHNARLVELQNELTEAKTGATGLVADINEKDRQIVDVKEDLATVQSHLTATEHDLIAKDNECSDLHEKIRKDEEARHSLDQSRSKVIENLENAAEKLNNRIAAQETTINTHASTITDLHGEQLKLEQRLEQVQAAAQEDNTRHDITIAAQGSTINNHIRTITSLEGKRSELQRLLEQEKTAAQRARKEHDTAIAAQQSEVNKHAEVITDLKTKQSNLEQVLEQERSAAQQAREEHDMAISKLIDEEAKSRGQAEARGHTLKTQDAQIQNLNSTLKAKEQTIKDKEATIRTAQQTAHEEQRKHLEAIAEKDRDIEQQRTAFEEARRSAVLAEEARRSQEANLKQENADTAAKLATAEHALAEEQKRGQKLKADLVMRNNLLGIFGTAALHLKNDDPTHVNTDIIRLSRLIVQQADSASTVAGAEAGQLPQLAPEQANDHADTESGLPLWPNQELAQEPIVAAPASTETERPSNPALVAPDQVEGSANTESELPPWAPPWGEELVQQPTDTVPAPAEQAQPPQRAPEPAIAPRDNAKPEPVGGLKRKREGYKFDIPQKASPASKKARTKRLKEFND